MNAIETQTETQNVKPESMRYVVGFLFNPTADRVALIRKDKPAWQAGLLNGIGGKIEPGETPEYAMAREFCEEVNYQGELFRWNLFCRMGGVNNDGGEFSVHFFYGIGNPSMAWSNEKEMVAAFNVCDIAGGWELTIGNLPWLVAIARDFAIGKHPPRMVTVEY